MTRNRHAAGGIRTGLRGFLLLLPLTVAALLIIPSHPRAVWYKALRHKAATAWRFEGSEKYVRYDVNYHVNANGSYVQTVSWALKVLTLQGLSDAKQIAFAYSDRLETVKILYAYTLKKDGGRYFAYIGRSRRKGRPTMFSDVKSILVVFPNVAVGDTVLIKYTVTQTKPTFPDSFSFIQSFSKFFGYDSTRVTMSAPASLRMKIETRDVQGGEIASTNGRKRWLWTYQNRRPGAPELESVSPFDCGPMIVASTFKNYGAVAAAYAAYAMAKAKPDAQIKKLADRITRNAHTERAQAAALYYWVSKNIRNVPNYGALDVDAPHKLSVILENRMGDSRDHSTLLRAMLAAKGIRSTSALIRSGIRHPAFTLPEIPTIDIFNRVITYIPSLHLYADSTSRFTPFGKLPLRDIDKPVIFTTGYDGIRHTPPTNWKDNGMVTNAVMTINPDGSATGETKFTMQGVFATRWRKIMASLSPKRKKEAVRRGLAGHGYAGTGTFNVGDPFKPTDVYHFSESFKVTDALKVPGPGAFTIREIGAGNFIEVSVFRSAYVLKRTVNFACMGGYLKQLYTIHFPANVKILSIPSDLHLKTRYANHSTTYSATYKRSGNTVTVARIAVVKAPGNVCAPKDHVPMSPGAIRIMKDLRAKILYK